MSLCVHVIGNVQLDVLASPVTDMPPPGGDRIIDQIAVRTAGAAGNVSLAMAALETEHRLFGAIGDDDAGRWVAADLKRLGLDRDLHVRRGEATGISIALEAPGRERAFLTAHGALSDYTINDVPDAAYEADIVLLTGYFSLPGLRGAGTDELLRRAKVAGAQTWFDTGWDPEDWTGGGVREVLDLLPLVDVFLPNEPEALALTGEGSAESAVRVLKEHCPGWVVVKRGADGLIAATPEGGLLHLNAPAVEPLDTTGAGDSLAAGAIAELARGANMPAALSHGVRVASTVVGRESHRRYPTREELLAG